MSKLHTGKMRSKRAVSGRRAWGVGQHGTGRLPSQHGAFAISACLVWRKGTEKSVQKRAKTAYFAKRTLQNGIQNLESGNWQFSATDYNRSTSEIQRDLSPCFGPGVEKCRADGFGPSWAKGKNSKCKQNGCFAYTLSILAAETGQSMREWWCASPSARRRPWWT